MILNNSFQFIFVHIPKTAGTSTTAVLSQLTSVLDQEIGGSDFGEVVQPAYNKRFGLRKHSTASEICNVIGSQLWNRYFSFSFVRDPFSRALSTYQFLREWQGFPHAHQQRIRSFRDFSEFVLSAAWDETTGPDGMLRPQVTWLRDQRASSSLCVDFVGKVEELDAGLKECLSAIGAAKLLRKFETAPILNASARTNKRITINSRVVDKIVTRYVEDFATFNYSTLPGESFIVTDE